MHNNYNLACAIHRHYQTTPEAPAVVCQGQSLTYRELAERSARLAACLVRSPDCERKAGRAPRVGILASRGIDACVALLGACWAGATYVPIGLKQPEERVLALLAQCELSALITDGEGMKLLTGRLLAACPQTIISATQMRIAPQDSLPGLAQIATLPPVIPEEPVLMTPSDMAYIMFTSGTTGVPKGVMISAGAVRHYVTMIVEQLELRAGDRALETCELSFDFSVHNMFSAWEAGAPAYSAGCHGDERRQICPGTPA